MCLTMTEKNPAAVALGKLGGSANVRKHGLEHYRRIGALGGAALKAAKGPEHFVTIGTKGGAAAKAAGADYVAMGKKGGAKVKQALALLAEQEKAQSEPPKAA